MDRCCTPAHARTRARRAARGPRRRCRSWRPPRARRPAPRGRRTSSSPSVSGDPRVGGTLTCDRGKWDDTAGAPYEYQYFWVREYGEPIDGAESATYVVTGDDAGANLICVVHALNGQLDSYGESEPLAARPPEARTAPVITGPSRLGGELRCSRGVWDDRDLPAYATQLRVAAGRRGDRRRRRRIATRSRLRDIGEELACEVTAAGASSATSPVTVPSAPIALTAPAISGAPRVGGTLACSRGTWDDEGVAPYDVAYQWFVDGEQIPFARSSAYTVQLGDAGHALSCRVTAVSLRDAFSASVRRDRPGEPQPPAGRRRPARRAHADLRPRHVGRPRLHLRVRLAARRRPGRDRRDLRGRRRRRRPGADLPGDRARSHRGGERRRRPDGAPGAHAARRDRRPPARARPDVRERHLGRGLRVHVRMAPRRHGRGQRPVADGRGRRPRPRAALPCAGRRA